MYIGDSLSLNIYESLLCLLHAAVPEEKFNQVILRENVSVTFLVYLVETDVDTTKTKVFFQGTYPAHYHGSEWGEPTVNSCLNETTPVNRSTYPTGLPIALDIVKQVLKYMSKPIVNLLDITKLSQLRKDGHPSIYSGRHGLDCTHWCIGIKFFILYFKKKIDLSFC
ncbi:hypothetical protein AABB24_032748 [Solanum stoloniferum]|uniref:Trichome birefringence-like C-terminal domain-containing protein n=1 Tax=Solanum stoloniferum TaxID=62892 RepID=A0ABD2RKB5_9SOLN